MATDRALIKSAIKLVETQEMAPERAIWEAATSFADQMAALGGYMAERVTDIHDVRARIVAELTGQQAPASPFLMSRSSWLLLTWHRLTPQPWTPRRLSP